MTYVFYIFILLLDVNENISVHMCTIYICQLQSWVDQRHRVRQKSVKAFCEDQLPIHKPQRIRYILLLLNYVLLILSISKKHENPVYMCGIQFFWASCYLASMLLLVGHCKDWPLWILYYLPTNSIYMFLDVLLWYISQYIFLKT